MLGQSSLHKALEKFPRCKSAQNWVFSVYLNCNEDFDDGDLTFVEWANSWSDHVLENIDAFQMLEHLKPLNFSAELMHDPLDAHKTITILQLFYNPFCMLRAERSIVVYLERIFES